MLAYGFSTLQPDRYTSTARVLYTDPAGVTAGADPTRAVDTFVQLAKTEEVLAPVAQDRGFSTTNTLRRTLTVKADINTDIVAVSATAPTAQAAANRANAVAERLVAWRNGARNAQTRARISFYTRQLAAIRDQSSASGSVAAADLRTQLAEARSQLVIPNPELQLVSRGEVPETKASPKPLRNGVIGLLVGLVIGLLVGAARDRLDRRIRSLESLRTVYRWPVLGLIPGGRRSTSSLTNFAGTSRAATAYRSLRTNLTMLDQTAGSRRGGNTDGTPVRGAERHRGRVYVVASACPGEGASLVVANLASAFAGGGQRVLAIGADLLKPDLAEQFGLDGSRTNGLADVLTGESSLTDAVRTVHVPQVWKSGGVLGVLASKRTFADPAILVAGSTMAELVETVRSRFDVVVIEASPLLGAGDAPILAALSDGLLVVASLDRLERDQAGRAAYLLDDLGIEPVGVVVTGYGGEIVEPPATPAAPPKPAPVRRQSSTQPQRV